MKTMLIYSEDFIRDEINEETGEVITPSHTEKKLYPFDLSEVVKVRIGWSEIEVLLADGSITKIEHVEEIYYR